MMHGHLTEEQIMAFLDGDDPELMEKSETHLRCCSACRHTAARYRQLFTLLERDPDFNALANLEDTVIASLPVKTAKRGEIREMLLAAAGFTASAAAALVIAGRDMFSGFTLPDTDKTLRAVSGLLKQVDFSNDAVFLAAGATLAVLLVALIDHGVSKKYGSMLS